MRLGGERPADAPPAKPAARLRREGVTIDGVATRSISAPGAAGPAVLLHGWTDNAETWLAVLERLAHRDHRAVAYDLPGFGEAPPLEDGSVLDQLTLFAAAAVREVADAAGEDVVVAGNSLGGWVALRLAERDDLPLAGIVLLGPAGIKMAPLFFTVDRIPAVARILGLPAPVPNGVVRSIAGRLFRELAFADSGGVDGATVDRYTRHMADRPAVAQRIDYAKRLRPELDRPFDPERIRVPVIALWGEHDRLCPAAGADDLADSLPQARIELIPNCGHVPQIEVPDLVVDAILEVARGA